MRPKPISRRLPTTLPATIRARALSFVQELRARCLRLDSFSRRFPLLHGYEAAGIRKAVHADYLIFFRHDDDAVSVIHIVHGASDYARLFEDD